jgi:tight adherence protein C
MSTIIFVLVGGLLIVTISAFFYAAFVFMSPTRTANDRLRDLGGEVVDTFDIISVDNNTTDKKGVAGTIASLAAPSSEEEKNKQRQNLMQAGFKHRRALEIFNSTRVTMAMGVPLIAAPIAVQLSPLAMAGVVVVACAIGYYLPHFYVENLVNKRKMMLLKSFPDALDLLVSCVEAGLGLDAAFRRVAMEMETAAPELAKEFQLVTHEVSAGVPRVEALRHLETRTGLDEVRSLVNMLAQAERFGTSIAKGLRIHAKVTRQKRMSRAEEIAAQVSPKLTVVMILALLPAIFVILLGPAGVKIYYHMTGKGEI